MRLRETQTSWARSRHDPRTAAPPLGPPGITSAEDQEQLDRALNDLVKDKNQWIDDFIKRLNYPIKDIGLKN